MVEIYKHDNIDFTANGDITLIPILKGKVELNGVCEIVLEHFYDEEGRWKYILEDSVIACPTPWSSKQLFRIYNVVKTMTGVTAYARHVYFDLVNFVLLDVRPTLKNGQDTLNLMLTNTPFTGHSNISTINTSYYIRKNIVEALASDDENSFVNRWGGERYLDNYNLTINDTIGGDYGVKVDFGYNLKEIEQDIDLDNVVTRIIPTGYNEIMLDGITPWVDSPNINKFSTIKTKVIPFTDIKVKENTEDTEGFGTLAEAQVELIARCNLLYAGGIDVPSVNYKVDMVNLAETTAYEGFEALEEINLGDTIQCKNSNLDIDINARCISLEWEVRQGKVKLTNIELGNFKENYFNNQSDINNRVKNILNENGTIKANEITGFIDSAKTKLKAQRAIGQLQPVRAMIFEDLDINSPTYGCMVGGSSGIEVSQTRTPDDKDWEFESAFTAEGLIADKIVGNVIASKNGLTKIYMQTGAVEINGGALVVKNNNNEVVIDGQYNMHKIVVTGTLRMTMSPGESTLTHQIVHNLGYIPHNMAHALITTDGVEYAYSFPTISYSNASGSFLGIGLLGRCWANSTVMEFVFVRPIDVDSTTEVFDIRYYIYKEVAI